MDSQTVPTPADAEIRQRILNAAKEQFLAFGFSKVTVDEIAAKLGMSKKTLYKFFPSKEEMMHELVRVEIQKGKHACRMAMEANDDFITKFKNIMSLIAMQYSQIRRPLLDDLRKYAPHIWQEIANHRMESINRDFTAMLEEGVRAGVFRRTINLELVRFIYSACIENLITPDVLITIPYSASQVFEAITSVLFEGIFTEGSLKQYRMEQSS